MNNDVNIQIEHDAKKWPDASVDSPASGGPGLEHGSFTL